MQGNDIEQRALVLDGPSFHFFDEDDEESKYHLLYIAKWCRAVIACRLTPSRRGIAG